MPERVIIDTAELTITEVTSAGWPNTAGSTRTLVTVWKVVRDQQQANTDALTAQARAAVDTVIASREVLRAIKDKTNASIGPADTKNVARELMDTQKQLLAVLRLIGGRVDSTDTGVG